VTTAAPAVHRSALDRALAAYPLVVAYAILLVLYAWQTTRHSTPWLFTDELEWAGLSRGIAHHGVPELRLEHAHSASLYSYLIAPAWWLGATGPAYAAAKYVNAIVMTASLFPGYALARLVVPRPAAVLCGVATASIPAVAYSGFLIPEALAYFWSTLTLWLVLRATLRPTRRTVAAVAVALLVAVFVRSQLAVLLPAAAVAVGVMAATSQRGRALIGRWSWQERLGAVVLLVGAFVWLGALANHHSYTWQTGGHYHDRMLTYGLWAFGAFAIGVGIVPVFAALAWLLSLRLRLPEDRALSGLLLGTAIGFGLYTAIKASYLSTNFAIRVEERNLVYLAPVVFAAAAVWAVRGRLRLVAIALSAAGIGYLLDTTPYHNYEKFYSDAPGLSILQWLNQKWYFTTTDARRLVFGVLIGAVAAAVARELAARRGGYRSLGIAGAALLGALAVAWNLAGEIQAANASNDIARSFRGNLPTPPDWIDDATGRDTAMFVGQSLAGSFFFWSTEFWNQSLGHIWSVDASAPGPGPVRTPNYLDLTGAVDPQLPIHWIVAAPGVDPVGTLKETVGTLRLYRVARPIRFADAEGGISTDGANWMSTSSWYYRFTSGGSRPGVATVSLSRAAACGSFAPSRITVKLARLRIDPETGQPVAGRVLAVRRVTLHSTPCETKVVTFAVQPPYRIDVTAHGTFQPPNDVRRLSAQVVFAFKPA
jgi:hypothetical protein